ncbi:hypothetical protein U0070_005196 [Myodes glareolus]|uniref:Large ribosomal subunit protein bL21m n=1 Tax=Myodes glareolus TaxID=447135 RepID=A0AAW0IG69_MYOGA
MAASIAAAALPGAFRRLVSVCSRSILAPSGPGAEVVRKVNELIATGQYGRLFAVVHFASHQWKVTSEDLILIENELDIQCGERIRLEKVLLVGADNFTLLGKPLLGKDLVRVEATVIEKTESWPRINMKFRKRKNFRKKKNRGHSTEWSVFSSPRMEEGTLLSGDSDSKDGTEGSSDPGKIWLQSCDPVMASGRRFSTGVLEIQEHRPVD